MRLALFERQAQMQTQRELQSLLPSLAARQQRWEIDYQQYEARANLRTALRSIPMKDYWHMERMRIQTGVSMVEDSMRRYELATKDLKKENFPKRIINLGTGIGLFDARPGYLTITAARKGYSYRGCDFSAHATRRCENRVTSALRKFNISNADIRFSGKSILSFLKKQPNASASIIVIFQVLQHMNQSEIKKLAKETNRVLISRGLVCVEFPPEEINNRKYFNEERTRLHQLSFIEELFNPYDLLASKTMRLFKTEKSFFAQFGIAHFHQ